MGQGSAGWGAWWVLGGCLVQEYAGMGWQHTQQPNCRQLAASGVAAGSRQQAAGSSGLTAWAT